jgi:hypothetical protein
VFGVSVGASQHDCELLNHASNTLRSHLELEPHKFLYHYTTQDGILGIVGRSEVWATKVHYMNDSTEFSLALKIAEDTITRGWSVRDIAALPEQPSLRLAHKLCRAIDRIANVNLFVACFCEDSDLLSQWQGYTRGSYGYSIGFDTSKLRTRAASGPFRFRLAKCIYDDATLLSG